MTSLKTTPARLWTSVALCWLFLFLSLGAGSASAADMSATVTGVPSVLRPGQVVTGAQLICSNSAGGGAAINPQCSVTATSGTLSALVCTPAVGTTLADGAAIFCSFDLTVPGTQGGQDEATTFINLNAQTGADNDTDASNNNPAPFTSIILDTVDDECLCPAGVPGQSADLNANDQVPIGSSWTLLPGPTCNNVSLNIVGTLTYDAPVSGTCSVPYEVCAPAPNGTVCDRAVFTSSANPATQSDMQPVFSGLPTVVRPGQAFVGLRLDCTNIGASTAAAASCSVSVSAGNISSLNCTPPPLASVMAGAAIACTFDYTAPGAAGGADEPSLSVTFTGQTGAANDNNGGNNPVAGNNQTTAAATVLDAVDDTATPATGATGQTANLAVNDQAPPGASWTVLPGGTCANASLAANGQLSYDAPASGACTVNYQVCAPAPDASTCDNAVFTATATGPAAVLAITTNLGTPQPSGPSVWDVPVNVRVSNPGDASTTVFNVQADNPLGPVFPGATTSIVAGSFAVTGPGCTAPAQAFDGVTRTALLTGTSNLIGGQNCAISFTVRADFGVNPVPGTPLLQRAFASGTAATGTANPGWTFPGGTPTAPPAASTTAFASDNTVVLTPQRLGIALSVAGIELLSNGRYRVTFETVATNIGTVPATNVQISNPLLVAFPAPVTLHTAGNMLRVSGDATACALNPGFSLGNTNLLTGSATWAPNATCTLRFEVEFTPNGQPGPFTHAATVSSHAAPPATVGANPSGPALAQDVSDSGIDPSGSNPGAPGDTGGSDDPTPIRLPAGISGSVWSDTTAGTAGNRQRDSGESGLQGWTVQALYPAGTRLNSQDVGGQVVRNSLGRLAETITSADGRYLLASLPAGTYDIRFFAPGATGLGAAYGTPVNGERGQPQPGSTVNLTSRVLQITLTDGVLVPEQSLPVDPSGVVYDSTTRQPVGGATVTLLDAAGTAVPDACVQPGQQNQVTTSGGAAGFYRFDINPGAAAACPNAVASYGLRVTPPAGYAFPSSVITPAAALPLQAGATYLVVPQSTAPQAAQPTTYHLAFSIGPGAADVIHNHVPLDPIALPGSALSIEKTADRKDAQVGDIVTYTIRLRNAGLTPLPAGEVTDNLPLGFKLMPGTLSFRFGNSTAATGLADSVIRGFPGPVLNWRLPVLNAGEELRFSYRVRVDIGADKGDGINRAFATAGAVRTTTVQARVRVSGGVFSSEAQVIGKVYVDCNQNKLQDQGEWGIPGVRIVMQDGTSVTTDENGLFSLQGLRAITHVLRVDPRTLPVGARLGTTSSRNMADPESLFIDLKNGELHRAEFREQSCFPKVLEQVRERRAKVAPAVPFNQTGKDDPWGLKFDSNQHPMRRTPALDNPSAPAQAPAQR